MISINNLLSDFEYSRERTLHRSKDAVYFDITMGYVPLKSETNFLNQIENIETTLQFILLFNDEFEKEQQYYVNVIKTNKYTFNIQTMQVIVKRVYPLNTNKYIDILPPKIECKENSLKNIQKLDHQIKAFEFLYPK